MSSFILTVRPQPDADLDVACLARRDVRALASPVMVPAYLTSPERPSPEMPSPELTGGLIFTSRHAIVGFLDLFGGAVPSAWRRMPVFAVGRASGRVARDAGSRMSPRRRGRCRAGPACRRAAHRIAAPLLWPCAVQRGFDMVSALAPDIVVARCRSMTWCRPKACKMKR